MAGYLNDEKGIISFINCLWCVSNTLTYCQLINVNVSVSFQLHFLNVFSSHRRLVLEETKEAFLLLIMIIIYRLRFLTLFHDKAA